MTNDIENLIVRLRKNAREVYSGGGYLYVEVAPEDAIAAADALEASEAEVLRQRDINRRAEIQYQELEAERDALRTENRKLLDKLETAMGVSEENDALRTVLDEIRALEPTWPHGMYGSPDDMFSRRSLNRILSGAIDTKEKP